MRNKLPIPPELRKKFQKLKRKYQPRKLEEDIRKRRTLNFWGETRHAHRKGEQHE